ncbi:hypothetical protein PI124_g10923 [Phytophthora idaei]|nr:hypothetical protein PI124_g10923 [Phytophthora idaei]
MTQRRLSEEPHVSRSVIRDILAKGQPEHHTSTIHPLLTAENKKARLRHAIGSVVHGAGASHFSPMLNVVHVDEKCFNEDPDQKVYYILSGETVPYRERKSKRFIGKTMFLAAI